MDPTSSVLVAGVPWRANQTPGSGSVGLYTAAGPPLVPASGNRPARRRRRHAGGLRGGRLEPRSIPPRSAGDDVPGLDARDHAAQAPPPRHDRGEPAIGGSDAQLRLQQVPAPTDELELSESQDEVTGLYQRALRLVQHQVEDRTWTAFWKATVESRTTAEVAAELGITPNAVRLAKSHVLRRLREEMGELIA